MKTVTSIDTITVGQLREVLDENSAQHPIALEDLQRFLDLARRAGLLDELERSAGEVRDAKSLVRITAAWMFLAGFRCRELVDPQ